MAKSCFVGIGCRGVVRHLFVALQQHHALQGPVGHDFIEAVSPVWREENSTRIPDATNEVVSVRSCWWLAAVDEPRDGTVGATWLPAPPV